MLERLGQNNLRCNSFFDIGSTLHHFASLAFSCGNPLSSTSKSGSKIVLPWAPISLVEFDPANSASFLLHRHRVRADKLLDDFWKPIREYCAAHLDPSRYSEQVRLCLEAVPIFINFQLPLRMAPRKASTLIQLISEEDLLLAHERRPECSLPSKGLIRAPSRPRQVPARSASHPPDVSACRHFGSELAGAIKDGWNPHAAFVQRTLAAVDCHSGRRLCAEFNAAAFLSLLR